MLSSLLFLLILFHHSQQKPALDPKDILENYGFLNTIDPDPKTLEEAVKRFQQVNELETTGTLNEATLARMGAPRCGRPSNIPEFANARNKWPSRDITYRIVNWTQPFTKSAIRNMLDDAIMAWSDNVNLKITESDSNRAEIQIHFSKQDGPSEVLAYAYFPEHGDMYFDQDEHWTLDVSQAGSRTYFGWVAAHELGHSLGLSHSETMKSIMFPYYSTQVTSPSNIDTASLRSIYGAAVMDKSILCGGSSVDAILDTKAPMLIKGKQYWVLDMSNGHIQSGPLNLAALFPRLPEKIDAAFMVGKISYFLADNLFYKFNHNSRRYSVKQLSIGFDNMPSNINAAFYEPKGAAIYFFKGSKYYRLDTNKPVGKRLGINGRNIDNDWAGIPKDIEAASLIGNSQVLFIKSGQCYVVDLDSRQLLRTENCASAFYGC